MAVAYQRPGVYREEKFLKQESALPTGVAGFVGLAKPKQGKPLVFPATPIALHHPEDFDFYFDVNKDSYLADAVSGFFLNGGVRCYVVYAESKKIEDLIMEEFIKAIESLALLHDVDVLAVPDAIRLPAADIPILQKWILKHCQEQGDRFAILDIPKDISDLQGYRNQLITNDESAGRNGALYCPWLKVKTAEGKDRCIPPCGHVAGIYARSDAKTGVFKAPANEEISGVFDLEVNVTSNDQDALNAGNINCICAFPGRGIRVWGARTLSADAQWRYINVRRLFITVRRWIDATMGWAVFEPDTPGLRIRIKRELDSYFYGLWRQGALQGDTPEQAFYVKCDADTNSSDNLDGQIITEIGLAPVAPAEFVVVRIVHRQPVIADAAGNQ